MIWLYAITDRPDEALPEVAGLSGAAIFGVREGELLAVASRHADDPGETTSATLWAHESVVERLMADRTVLPMRFGTRLDDDDAAVRASIAAGRDELVAGLDRVRGRVELAVRAMDPRPRITRDAQAEPTTGREYLFAKVADRQRADALHAPLDAVAVEAVRQPTRDDEVLRAAYLVERSAVAEFRSAVDLLTIEHPELAVLCTGSWPPYSFAPALARAPVAGGAR